MAKGGGGGGGGGGGSNCPVAIAQLDAGYTTGHRVVETAVQMQELQGHPVSQPIQP